MKQLLFFLLFVITTLSAFAQDAKIEKDTIFVTPETYISDKAKTVATHHGPKEPRDTVKVTNKSITYYQTRIEMFSEVDFDTVFNVQYAIVSEIISMPENSVAMSFYTNEQLMYMICSDRYYASYLEAVAIGERERRENPIFEYFIVKPCVVPKSSPIVKIKEQLKGDYRIQYSVTDSYPKKVLDSFVVEAYKDRFREVSNRTFDNKEQAISWLQARQLPLKDFWVYSVKTGIVPLVKKENTNATAESSKTTEEKKK